MVDIHCHILSELDDGPQSVDASHKMAHSANKAGITHLFATPHHLNGRYETSKATILDHVHKLNQYLQQENIPLIVHPGQEVRIHRDIFFSLELGDILTLDDKGKYLLLELPAREVPAYTQEMIYELLLKGITPIIVHPERNRGFMEDHQLLFDLIQEGALSQLTSGSIMGHFGNKIKSFSEKMIEHHLAHFIASDAHNVGSRGFCLQDAYDIVTKVFGSACSFNFKNNAELLLIGHNLRINKPIPIRKKILGIF